MKFSVILAHPSKASFNHAIATTVVEGLNQNGHEVRFHDLYEERFDPILPIEEIPKDVPLPLEIETHCKEISEAEGIIIVHPNWWGQPPAILKGWIDRVIRPGVAYEFLEEDKGKGIPRGLSKAESALVFNTSNTESPREKEVFGGQLESLWKNCIFDLCGVPGSIEECSMSSSPALKSKEAPGCKKLRRRSTTISQQTDRLSTCTTDLIRILAPDGRFRWYRQLKSNVFYAREASQRSGYLQLTVNADLLEVSKVVSLIPHNILYGHPPTFLSGREAQWNKIA